MPYKNPKDQKKYRKRYYEQNRQKAIDYSVNYNKQKKQRIRSLIKELLICCQVCGYSKSKRALCFHHLNPSEKEFTIALAVNLGYSLNRIKNEIKKCIIVCSNCHAEIHDGSLKNWSNQSESN